MKALFKSYGIGIVIGLMLSIIFSYIFGEGHYFPQSPVSTMGKLYYAHLNEPSIMLLSTLLWGLIGVLFHIGGYLFEGTEWPLWKITTVHFILMLGGLCPLGILAGWFPLKLIAILSFIVMYIIVYIIIWLINFHQNKKHIEEINRSLLERNQ
ncbi:DUF3021 domain-containing protein [Staphylococcus sp. SQ8-PEA]|uniref:DUF3021 domain-containing protein n=1 Tax=Staphylococcus marylandisciuri TaxID=2981529 RepID=A0ABT2QR79_9STAP|nr:DUF3021 domain-containing protein [Staphylococcus marylandisciuri]MCU5746485.1 DUF3021 domain-containing protein [Staphylococcus marylandisciuri]